MMMRARKDMQQIAPISYPSDSSAHNTAYRTKLRDLTQSSICILKCRRGSRSEDLPGIPTKRQRVHL